MSQPALTAKTRGILSVFHAIRGYSRALDVKGRQDWINGMVLFVGMGLLILLGIYMLFIRPA